MAKLSLHFELHKRTAPQVDKRTKKHKAPIPSVHASDFAALREEHARTLPLNVAQAMRHGKYMVR